MLHDRLKMLSLLSLKQELLREINSELINCDFVLMNNNNNNKPTISNAP